MGSEADRSQKMRASGQRPRLQRKPMYIGDVICFWSETIGGLHPS